MRNAIGNWCRLGACLGVMLLAAPAASLAGEPAPGATGQPAPATGDTPLTTKPATAQGVFKFGEIGQGGGKPRRDPFSFSKKPLKLPTLAGSEGKGVRPVVDKTEISLGQQKKMKEDGLRFYDAAERAFMDGDVAGAVENTKLGLAVFKVDALYLPQNATKYRELIDLKEKIAELNAAATKVKQRQDAERDFNAMSLRLTGVVAASPRLSRAVVDGQVVAKGEVVRASDKDDVLVDEIRPDQVIMNFRGYRMPLLIAEPRSTKSGPPTKK